MKKIDYKPASITPGLWRYQTRPLQFSLVVDEFGVNYERQSDITHILDALRNIYKISEEWNGKLYCVLSL